MALVMEACDYLYVLDFGKPLFEGTPVEVSASPVVQAAYLGEPDVAVREPGEPALVPSNAIQDGA
jgi:hypothetical protein